ncbi:MAG: hypothetical protein K0U78_02240 [Actinomycetia bacterium]|nr:hypothetical protein [Actinomycetes bacterium]
MKPPHLDEIVARLAALTNRPEATTQGDIYALLTQADIGLGNDEVAEMESPAGKRAHGERTPSSDPTEVERMALRFRDVRSQAWGNRPDRSPGAGQYVNAKRRVNHISCAATVATRFQKASPSSLVGFPDKLIVLAASSTPDRS